MRVWIAMLEYGNESEFFISVHRTKEIAEAKARAAFADSGASSAAVIECDLDDSSVEERHEVGAEVAGR